jgi:hypothetical protein
MQIIVWLMMITVKSIGSQNQNRMFCSGWTDALADELIQQMKGGTLVSGLRTRTSGGVL